jgi:uncharacterized protein
MVNEVALGLLFGLVGWKVALTYLGVGLGVANISGWIIGRLHLEHWLDEWVRNIRSTAADLPSEQLSASDRIKAALEAAHEIVGKVWPWIIAGIAAGAFIHGYVPADLMICQSTTPLDHAALDPGSIPPVELMIAHGS